MKPTTHRESSHPITVDIDGLSAMLSCGEATARKIAADSRSTHCCWASGPVFNRAGERYLQQIAE